MISHKDGLRLLSLLQLHLRRDLKMELMTNQMAIMEFTLVMLIMKVTSVMVMIFMTKMVTRIMTQMLATKRNSKILMIIGRFYTCTVHVCPCNHL